MAGVNLNPHIFRQYDIRGLVGRDLTGEVVEMVGRAYGSQVRDAFPGPRRPVVTVGRDVRESSREFAAALGRGIAAAGVDVVDIGLAATPVLYFSIFHWDTQGGVMVTGSHNPVTYNGLKMCVGRWPIHGDEIQALRERIRQGRFASGTGVIESRDAIPAYLAQLKGRFPERFQCKVVVDAGNGCAGPLFPGVLRDLGCKVHELYCEPDGTFPNHLPDPEVPAHVADLMARVRETNSDLGLAFDGDADRVGVIDEHGEKVSSDRLLLLFAHHYLARYPGGKIVYDIKCSEILEAQIAAAGGVPIIWKTGHSLIKQKMREEGALLAGELSGHICIYKDYYGFDDAFFAALLALEISRREERSLSALLARFPRTFTTHEVKVGCADEAKFRAVDHVLRRARGSGGKVIDIDGARIVFPDGWSLVRASNTTPNLTLRFESQSREGLGRQIERTEKVLREIAGLDLSELERAKEELSLTPAS